MGVLFSECSELPYEKRFHIKLNIAVDTSNARPANKHRIETCKRESKMAILQTERDLW